MKRIFPLLAWTAICLGCAPTPPEVPTTPKIRIETLPLLSLVDPDAEIERRWIDLADRRAPAFVTSRNARLTFPLKPSPESPGAGRRPAGRLRAAIGFAAPGRGKKATPPTTTTKTPTPTRARFRALCDRDVFFETVRDAAPTVEVEPLEATLPAACSELTLEILFVTPRKRGPRRRAVWVDPLVEIEHPAASPQAPPGAPNLLLITSDTTRRDVLGPYGAAPTPALDALAAEGLVFDNAFSVAFGTTPSHASLFSALPASEHGVYDNASVLAERHITLAETLRDAGYRTAAFVGAQPVVRGVGLAQGFDLYDDIFAFDAVSGLGKFSTWERRADVTVDRFFAWLEERPATRPYFVWLHFFDPHQPYAPPDRQDRSKEPVSLRLRQGLSAAEAQALEAGAQRRYRKEVEHLDRQIGRVLEKIDDSSTLIALIADHGENFLARGEHLAFGHSGLYHDVAQVPLILRLPDRTPVGRRGFLLGNLDLAPTLLDLLGVEAPTSWQGRSFRRRLSEDGAHRPHVVLEGASRFEIAVRTPEWTYRELGEEFRTPDVRRLLGYAPGAWRQLYDRRVDPEERVDLSTSGATAETAMEELTEIVARARARQEAAEASTVDSEAHREALKALGYLGP